jgi:hypothetical protein
MVNGDDILKGDYTSIGVWLLKICVASRLTDALLSLALSSSSLFMESEDKSG